MNATWLRSGLHMGEKRSKEGIFRGLGEEFYKENSVCIHR